MNDIIKQDDEKLCEMIVKQYPDGYPIFETDNAIENDDLKIEELLDLQSVSELPPEPSSIEDKYEEELLFKQIAEDIVRRLNEEPMIIEYDDEGDMEG
jgi:hypothetical protein